MRPAVFRVPGVVARRLAARAERKAAAVAALKQRTSLTSSEVASVSRKVVQWLDLIRRRVDVPSDELAKHPETEALVLYCIYPFL